MTFEQLKESRVFLEAWATVWPMLKAALVDRQMREARGMNTAPERAQSESARVQEMAQLIGLLDEIEVVRKPAPTTLPPILNSMKKTPQHE